MLPPGCDTPVLADWALALVDDLADYMVLLFHQEICQTTAREPISLPKFPIEVLCEAECLVGIMVSAYGNKSEPDPPTANNMY